MNYFGSKILHRMITCVLNWALQAFIHDYFLVSHTTYIVSVNFIQFNVNFKQSISEQLYTAILFYTQSFCLKSNERKATKEIFFPAFDLVALYLISYDIAFYFSCFSISPFSFIFYHTFWVIFALFFVCFKCSLSLNFSQKVLCHNSLIGYCSFVQH